MKFRFTLMLERQDEPQREACIEAIEEAAGHMELEWTDDPRERAAGLQLSRALKDLALRVTRPRKA